MTDYQKGYCEALEERKNMMLVMLDNDGNFSKEEIYERINDFIIFKVNQRMNEK